MLYLKNIVDYEYNSNTQITNELYGNAINKYNEYVEKNLKGEACYRIPQADYNYLRQLFHFNGIPHYEWIEKDGTVLRNSPGTYNLEKYLKKRFGNKD